jgi:ABC-type transport system involved in multi-copper enzyme maturation permease subunit
LVDEAGQLEVAITCEEPAQYFGMAQADVYVRGRDSYFLWNFVKGYLGIWLQMLMVTCFAVTLSTCLSGPVAMFGTLIIYVVGFFRGFIISVATGEQPGGGPVESMIRTVTQKNMMTELDMGVVIDTAVPALDKALMFFVWLAAMICPNFKSFNTSRFVAYGFNIPGDLLAQNATVAAAFFVVLSIYGYFLLKSREVAA